MVKSELIYALQAKFPQLGLVEINAYVEAMIECMADALVAGRRIEIRDFGAWFSVVRKARLARNPRTGRKVQALERRAIRFKAGKALKDQINLNTK